MAEVEWYVRRNERGEPPLYQFPCPVCQLPVWGTLWDWPDVMKPHLLGHLETREKVEEHG